jgi:actin-like ATPase involved in cell morphogenesis
MAAGHHLGIDFGTSNTVAMLSWPDGRVRPLLFDGSPLLPSAVWADGDGRLIVGRDAMHSARIEPARFEGSPKRRIDDGSVLLGEHEFPVPVLIAAVLSRVAEEAVRVGGGTPATLTMTHPAQWGVSRRLLLIEAADLAGLPKPRLVPEPVAAAMYFTEVLGQRLAADGVVVLYDFGAGTFDASVVGRGEAGLEAFAVDGIDDVGGIDLDALIVGYVREHSATANADAWTRLDQPQTADDRRQRRLLWEEARVAKEMLSRTEATTLQVPGVGDVTVPRAEFERLARPMLEQTVRTTAAVLRWSKRAPEQVAGVFLVGGSSRIPLVSTLLTAEFTVPPTSIEQPELVVAEGSLQGLREKPRQTAIEAPTAQLAPVPVSPPPIRSAGTVYQYLPAPPPPVRPVPARQAQPARPVPARQAQPAPPRRAGLAFVAGAAVAALLVAAIVFGRPILDRLSASGPNTNPTGTPTRSDQTTGAPTATTQNPSAKPSSAAPTRPAGMPDWVPADWTLYVDRPAGDLWRSQDESEGGRCEVSGADLHVTRENKSGLVGCTITSGGALDRKLTDSASQVEVTVKSGCAGMWARTGTQGYFVTVCDAAVNLYLLGGTDPDSSNQLASWPLATAPQKLLVGFLANGSNLSVYAAGKLLGTVSDSTVRSGKDNAGGYTTGAHPVDVTYHAYRLWAPSTPASP